MFRLIPKSYQNHHIMLPTWTDHALTGILPCQQSCWKAINSPCIWGVTPRHVMESSSVYLSAAACAVSLLPLYYFVKNTFRNSVIRNTTALQDLPYLGTPREGDRIQGTAVVCGGRYNISNSNHLQRSIHLLLALQVFGLRVFVLITLRTFW